MNCIFVNSTIDGPESSMSSKDDEIILKDAFLGSFSSNWYLYLSKFIIMKFIADFHIHSHYSLATSKELRPDLLDYWAGMKGIKVIGTGDFTHPGWLRELREQLEPAEEGLYMLKKENRQKASQTISGNTRFILTTEISNIYKKKGRVRKVHNVIFVPSFIIAERIQNKLVTLGFNITSDGRPIIGMDSRDLLELCLETSEDICFMPAHIWTPWFSVLGSESGFDSLDECFEDLSSHIRAVEMGLSTDPPMNWSCSFLDKYTLCANSDAHSPEKLGRNANLFETDLSYKGIIDSMSSGDPENFLGTINFFPQEGKYHFDGHRKCGLRWNPLETLKYNKICPVCGKNITVGVMNRIAQLADRDNIMERKIRHPFHSLIPLKEILSEIEGVTSDSKKVDQQYKHLVNKAGSEFNLLLHYDLEYIKTIGGELVSEAIRRMRNREVYIQEGFDGEYGTVRVFKDDEIKNCIPSLALSLFEEPQCSLLNVRKPLPLLSFDLKAFRDLKHQKQVLESQLEETPEDYSVAPSELNTEQTEAVEHFNGPALILAGPGTGKTKVLTSRIACLVQKRNITPGSILAITFTNKAAREMKERLSLLLDKRIIDNLSIGTFHSFGHSIIKKYLEISGGSDCTSVIDEDDKENILSELIADKTTLKDISKKISEIKQSLHYDADGEEDSIKEIFIKYNNRLKVSGSFDFDDLISTPVQLFQENPDFLSGYRNRIKWILVDEYQDINLPQYRILRMLMPEPDSNLFAIGDPDQAIYGFRGADVRYIQLFMDDFKDAKIFSLRKSYRCTDAILKASGNVLKKDNEFLSGIKKGIKIRITENATDKSEAEFIARAIESMIGGVGFFSIDSQITGGRKEEEIESLSDFAILCRISRLMPVIEKALNDHNIPYHKVAEKPVFKQEPLKSILDIYRFSLNPENRILKSRILSGRIVSEHGLLETCKSFRNKNLTGKLEYIINHYFRDKLRNNELAIELMLETAGLYEKAEEDFMQDILLGTEIDSWKPNIEAVNLMTLHASKGLEFDCVFITGCEETILPYSLHENNPSDPEEERRLLYVGMTRAKNRLFLTSARRRFLMGREYSQKRSRFLDQIKDELAEAESYQIKVKEKKDHDQLELF